MNRSQPRAARSRCASGIAARATPRLSGAPGRALCAALPFACAIVLSIAPSVGAEDPLTAPTAVRHGRTITVLGVGRERATPDRAELRIAVEQTAPSAQAASQQAAKAAGQVIETLRKAVGSDGRVDTASYQLTPVYRVDTRTPPREHGPEIVGYTALNQLAVETRRLDAVGALIDAAISAGAARVDTLSFTIADPAPVQKAALRAAGGDAAAQAAAIAESLHVTLKNVLEASTESMERPLPQQHFASMMRAEAAMAPTPIEPGEVTTEARVRVTYGIE
jgi:uncharacterized protein YggE